MRHRHRRARWPWLLAVPAVLGVLGWLAFQYVLEPPEDAPVAAPALAPVPPGPTPRATLPPTLPTPEIPLPPLGESDPLVQDEAKALASAPAWAAWLRSGSLVRRFVAAVENVADGDSPRSQLAFLAPQGSFGVLRERERVFVDPAGQTRYDLIGDVVGSLDATAAVRLYRTLSPLLESAYGELGRPDRTFDATLRLALARLLATPILDGPVELTPRMMTYAFAEPGLEALSPAEKHLVRMGPRNARLVQGKVRDLLAALDAR